MKIYRWKTVVKVLLIVIGTAIGSTVYAQTQSGQGNTTQPSTTTDNTLNNTYNNTLDPTRQNASEQNDLQSPVSEQNRQILESPSQPYPNQNPLTTPVQPNNPAVNDRGVNSTVAPPTNPSANPSASPLPGTNPTANPAGTPVRPYNPTTQQRADTAGSVPRN